MTARVRPMTGYHMLMIMIGFFAVVFAVNFYMAWLATSTFSGTVVDNSYVASQKFNGWLAEARTEKALGWQTDVSLDTERHIMIAVRDKAGRALAPLDATGTVERALVNEKPTALHLEPVRAGVLRSSATLPLGRWHVHVQMVSGTHKLRYTQDLK